MAPWAIGGLLLGAAAVPAYDLVGSFRFGPPPKNEWSAETWDRHRRAARDCDAARGVGLAGAFRGYPGYHAHLDRDRDGVACEWSVHQLWR